MYEHNGTVLDLRSNTPQLPAGFQTDTREILMVLPHKASAPPGSTLRTLHQVISKFLHQPRADEVISAATKGKRTMRDGSWSGFRPVHNIDVASKSFGLHEVRLRMRRVVTTTEIALTHGGYAGAAVAVGSAGEKDRLNVAFVQIEGRPILTR